MKFFFPPLLRNLKSTSPFSFRWVFQETGEWLTTALKINSVDNWVNIHYNNEMVDGTPPWGEKPSSLQGAFHVMLIRQELCGEQLLIEVIKIFCFSTEPAISELRVVKSRLLSFKSEELVWRHKYCPRLDPQLISKVFVYTDKPLFCHHLLSPGDQELLCVINSF